MASCRPLAMERRAEAERIRVGGLARRLSGGERRRVEPRPELERGNASLMAGRDHLLLHLHLLHGMRRPCETPADGLNFSPALILNLHCPVEIAFRALPRYVPA